MDRDPLARRRSRHGRTLLGFESVWLNLYGWSALVGLGLVTGAIAALVTSLPVWAALATGVIAVWLAIRLVDHFRFRNSKIAIGHGDVDRITAERILARLEEMGIAATYREEPEVEEDESPHRIVCRQADADKVWRVMDEVVGSRPPLE